MWPSNAFVSHSSVVFVQNLMLIHILKDDIYLLYDLLYLHIFTSIYTYYGLTSPDSEIEEVPSLLTEPGSRQCKLMSWSCKVAAAGEALRGSRDEIIWFDVLCSVSVSTKYAAFVSEMSSFDGLLSEALFTGASKNSVVEGEKNSRDVVVRAFAVLARDGASVLLQKGWFMSSTQSARST